MQKFSCISIPVKLFFHFEFTMIFFNKKYFQKPWTHKSEKLQRYSALSWAQIDAPTLGLKKF